MQMNLVGCLRRSLQVFFLPSAHFTIAEGKLNENVVIAAAFVRRLCLNWINASTPLCLEA